ncbi:hypothetical protein SRHO_G00251840 [Serrasalmus rhombeus]
MPPSPQPGSAMDTVALRADVLASLKTDIIKSELNSAHAEELSSLKSELKEVKTEIVNTTAAIRTEMDAMKHTVSDMEAGLSSWSSEVIELRTTAAGLKTEMAELKEKVLTPRKPNGKPWVVITKLHYYQDCVHVLCRVRESGPLRYKGEPIAIFPDYTTKVAKAKAFNNVQNLLRGRRDVRYGIIFPARLRISFNGDVKEFLDPEKVMT